MKKLFTLIILALASFAHAQTACDSLDIDVKYSPFSDSTLTVSVINSNQGSFGYPVFTVYDSNGDTVAVEPMTFFGIGQSSSHTLNVTPGWIPSSIFNGTLTLYYQTVDSYAICTWPMSFSLCPDTCTTVYTSFYNVGSMEVTGTAQWEILDSNSLPVASGTFTLDTANQSVIDSVCLLPGDFTLKVKNINLSPGGQISAGLYTSGADFMSMALNNADSIELPYSFYEACSAPTSVKEAKSGTAINIHSFERNVYINSPDALGSVIVYSVEGRKVYNASTQGKTQTIDLSNQPAGIYIVRVGNKGGTKVSKVFIAN